MAKKSIDLHGDTKKDVFECGDVRIEVSYQEADDSFLCTFHKRGGGHAGGYEFVPRVWVREKRHYFGGGPLDPLANAAAIALMLGVQHQTILPEWLMGMGGKLVIMKP